MKSRIITLFILSTISTFSVAQTNPSDSVQRAVWLNTSAFGPLVHPGVLIGIDLTLYERFSSKKRGRLAMKMGLRDEPKIKYSRNGLYFDPHFAVYNHRFNHTGLLLGGSFRFEHQFNSGLFYLVGFELGRMVRVHRDVVVFDERNTPSQRNFTSTGHYQLGTQLGLGYGFKSGRSVFYRYHIGLQFPFNHLAGGYARHELGAKLIRL